MPLSSSFPDGAPTLAEVLLQRTFDAGHGSHGAAAHGKTVDVRV